MASEAGVLPIPPRIVKLKGRLQPGKMFIVDMKEGRIVPDDEIKEKIAAEKPYREWLEQAPRPARRPPEGAQGRRSRTTRRCCSASRPLVTPLKTCACSWCPWQATAWKPSAPWARHPARGALEQAALLYDYFKQLFAQVTNPPIDCIREEIVTSAETTIGSEGNLLDPKPKAAI
jgi:hypothetical protein